MKAAVLLLLVAALAACRSASGERPSRDYTSLNRSSIEFLLESARTAREARRENLAMAVHAGPRIRGNLREAREGRAFARESFWGGMWAETVNTWHGILEELRWDGPAFASAARFGHVDTGD